MLTDKFEILLAPTCTEQELGKIEVWGSPWPQELNWAPDMYRKTTFLAPNLGPKSTQVKPEFDQKCDQKID